MKSIRTVIPDVYDKLQEKGGWFSPELASSFSAEVTRRLLDHFNRERVSRLRLSGLRPMCDAQLWHSIHRPELAEPLTGRAMLVFSYGHMIEAQSIVLARATNHAVEGEQDELNVLGVLGHRDCVLDGHVCDVKSCSPMSYEKFKTGKIRQDDQFGYLEQLDGYLYGSLNDPLVKVKDTAFIWAIDKSAAKMFLYEHTLRKDKLFQTIEHQKAIVALAKSPPCTCQTVKEGESGNMKLDVKGSYSSYKYVCWPELKTALYAKSPVYLTKIVRWPTRDVVVVDRFGKKLSAPN